MASGDLGPVLFVVPGDLHLTEAGQDNHRVALWMTDEVNGLVRPDFVQFIGDNAQDATHEQFRLFRELTGRLAVPWFALVGDHDVKDDPAACGFRKWVGETHGSLSLRGFRFLRLNTQQGRPVGLSLEQLDWLRDNVRAAEVAGQRVVLFQHNYPYQIWEDFAGPGIDAWRALVQTCPVTAIFTGHTHYGQVTNDGRNVVVTTRSIGDPEGGPPGYVLAYLHGDDLAVTYRSVEDRGPLVLIAHPRDALLATGPAHVVRGPDRLRALTWSGEPLVEVSARVEDGPWAPLEAEGRQSWTGPLPGDRLSKGRHRVTVRAVDRRGGLGEQTIEVAVDPTGRYTAVPCVRPVVTATNFC